MHEIKKRIVLVDDHVIVRNGLKELIEKLGPYEVTQQFDNGKELLDAMPLLPEPDLVLLDISMPGISGDKVMEWWKQEKIQIPVLILTLNQEEDKVINLFRLGIRGYLPKNCTADTLKKAITSIFDQGYYHNEYLSYSLQTTEVASKKTEQQHILEQLTEREKEFLNYVCHEKEYTYGQIADLMHVQPRTVDGYREAIFEKFGIKSKTGLVLFILRHQLGELLEQHNKTEKR
jgi:two-component system, NarL family, invasion response regulator UvrY